MHLILQNLLESQSKNDSVLFWMEYQGTSFSDGSSFSCVSAEKTQAHVDIFKQFGPSLVL